MPVLMINHCFFLQSTASEDRKPMFKGQLYYIVTNVYLLFPILRCLSILMSTVMQTNTKQQQKGMWKDVVSENELKIPHVQIQQKSAFTLIASILPFK